MPDYQHAKIYKIFSYENDEVYYGSTIDTLSRRMTGHRTMYKKYKEGKSNNNYTSFKIIELTSAKIELVENYPCNSKEELLQREGYYIKNNNCVNKNIPGRTPKEYCEENKEQRKEYNKVYYEQNKEHKKEYRKKYGEANKEKHKKYMKEYHQRKKKELGTNTE